MQDLKSLFLIDVSKCELRVVEQCTMDNSSLVVLVSEPYKAIHYSYSGGHDSVFFCSHTHTLIKPQRMREGYGSHLCMCVCVFTACMLYFWFIMIYPK